MQAPDGANAYRQRGGCNSKRASTYTTGLQHGLAIQQGSIFNGNRAGLVFQSLDGFSVAGINGVISTHSGTQANNVGYLEFYTKPSGVSAAQERMRIDSAGLVNFSTNISDSDRYNSTGYHCIHSDRSSSIILALENSSSAPYGLLIDFSDADPDNNSNYFLRCNGSGGTERIFIWSDGDIDNHDNSYSGMSALKT